MRPATNSPAKRTCPRCLQGWEEHLNRQGRLRDMAVDVGDRQQLVPSQYVADRQTVAQLRTDPRAIQRAATAAERISDIPPIANTDIYKGGGLR
jgi:hypothetical protein